MMRVPLYVRILAAVTIAVILGLTTGQALVKYGELGTVVIRLLKLLATPLVFFAVIDAFIQTDIPPQKGARLLGISAVNAVVATAIGLGVAHVMQGGVHWRGKIDLLLSEINASAASAPVVLEKTWVQSLSEAVPKHIVEPFTSSSILPVMAFAVAVGIALRRVRARDTEAFETIARFTRGGLAVCSELLKGLIFVIPLAIVLIVTAVVAKTGTHVFSMLGWFLATIVLGMALHVLVYYPLLLTAFGGRSPVRFFRAGLDAIITALSAGSSLATLPVTLRCLDEEHKVSPDSARLAACVGTNLNHDGIILYEAAAAVFITQAIGVDLTLAQQLTIAGASVMAGVGIAGVPEAGLITLPLVLGAAGVPDAAVVTVIPLLFTVDWLIGRLRAATNVTSDMIVAVLLDR